MQQALADQAFVDAFTCLYANSMGGLIVVGTLLWFTISTMSYARTGSFAMPAVYTLILGGGALSQVATPVLGFASILLLGAFGLLAVLIARRIETP
ncbi:hypothetical protein Hbl1158_16995 (plasmid) [Halobaculum sp. CBA1158]|uniref:hypothetical protein n=1 Tax=Halobaculum sp. CBA1158 TaxID=2904243 RepID=UPI001F1D6131|nr:hypothetical protein [Halobaculum sp. CBA1158]UIP01700.1 hypothetical protein Hbl1158_16995 [Halobaculum sp. CBA1158]